MRLAVLIAVGSLTAACSGDVTPSPAAPSVEPEIADESDAPVESSNAESAETLDQELERLVRTHDARPMWTIEDLDDPASLQQYRRDLVLKARERAAADIANGDPRIVIYGLTLGDSPDIDPETGFAYCYLG